MPFDTPPQVRGIETFFESKTVNTMASISARSFSVEETRRYAGGLDDPARVEN
jgi:hypothetical protein